VSIVDVIHIALCLSLGITIIMRLNKYKDYQYELEYHTVISSTGGFQTLST